jgi:hypothetical protein
MLNGRCLACGGDLGHNTQLVINKHGIVMVYCCGQCLSDYNTMGWLSEQYDDITQQMQFRGGSGGN